MKGATADPYGKTRIAPKRIRIKIRGNNQDILLTLEKGHKSLKKSM